MRPVFRLFPALLACVIGCTLPSYKKIGQGELSCPDLDFPGEKAPECLECVRAHCCDVASACVADDACSPGFTTELTPFSTDVPTEFDSTLGCMQTHCDAICNVSFACQGKNYFEFNTAKTAHDFPMQLIDFSLKAPAAGIRAKSCSGYGLSCVVDTSAELDPSTEVVSDMYGLADIPVLDKGDGQVVFADPEYELDSTSMADHPPHVMTWSEPIQTAKGLAMPGVSFRDFLFTTSDVQLLVENAAGKAFDREDSHIVFFMHNCLPLRYLPSASPHAGVSGASITLKYGLTGEVFPPVYRTDKGYASLDTKASFSAGSGGAAAVPSGFWHATAQATDASAPFFTMDTDFFVPVNGIGVVHLFPKTVTP